MTMGEKCNMAPTGEQTLDSAPIEFTPELIKELEPDLQDVVKRCPDCGKPFVKKSPNTRFCRDCAASRKREQIKASNNKKYHANIEESRATRRENYVQNRDTIRAYQATYYTRHKAELKERRKSRPKDKDAERAYQAEYYAKNKERIKAQRKEKKKSATDSEK